MMSHHVESLHHTCSSQRHVRLTSEGHHAKISDNHASHMQCFRQGRGTISAMTLGQCIKKMSSWRHTCTIINNMHTALFDVLPAACRAICS